MEAWAHPIQTDERPSMAMGTVVHFLRQTGACKTFHIIYRAHEKLQTVEGASSDAAKRATDLAAGKG